MFEVGEDPRYYKHPQAITWAWIDFPKWETMNYFYLEKPTPCSFVNGMRLALANVISQLSPDGCVQISKRDEEFQGEDIPLEILCYQIMKDLGMILQQRADSSMFFFRKVQS